MSYQKDFSIETFWTTPNTILNTVIAHFYLTDHAPTATPADGAAAATPQHGDAISESNKTDHNFVMIIAVLGMGCGNF